MRNYKDFTPKDTKDVVSAEGFQNTLVILMEHVQKCEYCSGLAKCCNVLEQVMMKHMKGDLT